MYCHYVMNNIKDISYIFLANYSTLFIDPESKLHLN